MGKKRNRTKGAEKHRTSATAMTLLKPMGRDDDGYVDLRPTEKGKKELDEIKMRISRKSKQFDKASTYYQKAAAETVKEDTEPPKAEPKTEAKKLDYDPKDVTEMLDAAEDYVKSGRFEKALEKRKQDLIKDLANAFSTLCDGGSYPDTKQAERIAKAVCKLIIVGKSFYEYAPNLDAYVDDIVYDGIVANWRALGKTEPTGIVPAVKDSKKTKIKYPTLHNNMDKVYRLMKDDPLPDGVKEDGSVEKTIDRMYKELELSENDELELEVSIKVDGVSVNGTKHGAILANPQTRGDETESMLIKGLNGIQIDDGKTDVGDIGIQFEFFVTYEDAEKASKYLKLTKPYAGPRQAAAGIINRLCTGEDDGLIRFLSFYPIEASGLDGIYVERMDLLREFGSVPDDMPEREIIKGNRAELIKKIKKIWKKAEKKRPEMSFAYDGIVITVVNDEYQKKLGRDGRTNRYQFALKFDPASAEAKVESIYLDSGLKGYRTIQLKLDRIVFLDGVRYDHVPVLSADLFRKLDLHEGDRIKVSRTGDVMPAITKIKEGDGRAFELPRLCPHCGKKLTIRNKKLFCENSACSGNLAGRILGFIQGIGMDGYGPEFVNEIVERWGADPTDDSSGKFRVRNIRDLFELTPKRFEKKGNTTKLAKEFIDVLKARVADTPDYVVLGSLGIPAFGPARAKMVLKARGGWDGLIVGPDLINLNFGMLRSILGDATADQIGDFTADHDLLRDITTMDSYVKIKTDFSVDRLRVGHTGVTLSDRVLKVARRRNFDIVDGKAFDILIAGDINSTSEKAKKAREKGIEIMDEDGFLKLYDVKYWTNITKAREKEDREQEKAERKEKKKEDKKEAKEEKKEKKSRLNREEPNWMKNSNSWFAMGLRRELKKA